MRQCEKCGRELNDAALFCPKCGTKVEVSIPATSDNRFSKKNILKIIVAIVISLVVIKSFSDNHSLIPFANDIPTIKNEELGVELPINTHTDWKIEETTNGKYVIYYNDPYKEGYPPYKEGQSPDIEKIICINDDSVIDDKFSGHWVSGLNETYDISAENKFPAEKYDRNANYTFSSLNISKNTDKSQYEMYISIYFLSSGTDDWVKDIQSRNGVQSPLLIARDGHSSDDYNGFDDYNIWLEGNIRVEGNKMIADMHSDSIGKVYMELLYHQDNDTLELIKLETANAYPNYPFFPLDFGLRGRNDILKRYKWGGGVSELTAGITQMKLDQLKESHQELTDYENIMLRYKHRALIPGTMDLSKPPPMPEFLEPTDIEGGAK